MKWVLPNSAEADENSPVSLDPPAYSDACFGVQLDPIRSDKARPGIVKVEISSADLESTGDNFMLLRKVHVFRRTCTCSAHSLIDVGVTNHAHANMSFRFATQSVNSCAWSRD